MTNRHSDLFSKERLEETLYGSSWQSPEEIGNNIWDQIGDFPAGTTAAVNMRKNRLIWKRDLQSA